MEWQKGDSEEMTAQTLIGKKPVRRALISVYDKSGLVPLAQGLHDAGVTIVSTGSTAKTIADKGIPVTPVEFVTGFPEILDGRVKTLHPHIHAGLLADTRNPEHLAALEKLNIEPFDLVVVNLYPFSETVDSGAEVDECVEHGRHARIDTGQRRRRLVDVLHHQVHGRLGLERQPTHDHLEKQHPERIDIDAMINP